jgi:general secretion pathway protein D
MVRGSAAPEPRAAFGPGRGPLKVKSMNGESGAGAARGRGRPEGAASKARGGTRRAFASLLVAACLLAAPAAALASKGQKNYRRGLEYERAQQWERAAEEFALAAAAEPSNAEYQLHYRRAVFNASQVFMRQGVALLSREDYVGAYNAFRRAHGYDPTNELALSMAERARRLQLGEREPGGGSPAAAGGAGAEAPQGGPGDGRARQAAFAGAGGAAPARVERLRAIAYSGDLRQFVKHLAREVGLNVVFDRDVPAREVEVDLRDVTAAQALDYVFLTQGLFFQKLSSRTILVADQSKRAQYQQLVLRTFYLSNLDPADARALIAASIPPQAGRQPVVTANKATNSITVRDTPENVRLIADLLSGVDKERAEVVMDVQIYEVSRTDLMQLGNQVGTEGALTNLGGVQRGLSVVGGSRQVVTQALASTPTALGAAFLVPATALSAFQRRDNTRLIASTQLHAFDGEKSTAHIGQRVPVQTAAVTSYGAVSSGENNPAAGVAQGLFGGSGYPVIQYEKTGLTLEFTPQVAPNLDVQVKMSIKSNDVAGAANSTLTPVFTERNIEGTARIQNNRTMMIASVAQNQQSRGRQGLPLVGLVPVLGRMFTAPRRNDSQTDIVIAVTPHVLRAPALTPSDEEMRPSGTMSSPASEGLEAMLREAAREEQLASARALPTNAAVEVAGDEAQSFVPAPKALVGAAAAAGENPAPRDAPVKGTSVDFRTTGRQGPTVVDDSTPARGLADADGGAAVSAEVADVRPLPAAGEGVRPARDLTAAPRSAAELRLLPGLAAARVGERRRLKLFLKTDAPLGGAALTFRFDPKVLAVRSVTAGDIFSGAGGPGAASLTRGPSPDGLLVVSLAPAAGAPAISGAGVLLSVEVEALAAGEALFGPGAEDVHLIAADGRQVTLKVVPARVTVTR